MKNNKFIEVNAIVTTEDNNDNTILSINPMLIPIDRILYILKETPKDLLDYYVDDPFLTKSEVTKMIVRENLDDIVLIKLDSNIVDNRCEHNFFANNRKIFAYADFDYISSQLTDFS